MAEIKKKVILYISSPEAAATLRERCAPIKPMLEIGLMKTFGAEPAPDSFKKINSLMTSGEIDWVAFHLPSVSQMIGSEIFLNEVKKLIRSKAVEKTKTYIIDAAASMNSDGRAAFEKFRVHIVDDESYIGDVFSNMLDPNQLDIAQAAAEDPLFEGLVDDGPRLPGMRNDTPTRLDKSDADPFDDFDAALATEDEDPFARHDAQTGRRPAGSGSAPNTLPPADNPFASFDISPAEMSNDPFANLSAPSSNPFDELDFGDAAPQQFAPSGPGATNIGNYQQDPFSSLSNPMGQGTDDQFMDWNSCSRNPAPAPASSNPFDAIAATASGNGASGGLAGEDDLSAFDDQFADADLSNGEFVEPGRAQYDAWNRSSMPAGADDDPFGGFEGVGGDDPFDGLPQGQGDGFAGGSGSGSGSGFGTGNFDPSEDLFDSHDLNGGNGQGGASGGYDGYGNGNDDGYGDGMGGTGGMGLMTVEQLLDMYGEGLGDNDYLKMKSMMEPKWDYVAEQEDGIGSAGGGFKLQIGKKGTLKGISQVGSDDLANSVYIREVEAERGYYSPPNECKILTSWAPKGGSGKSLPWLTFLYYYDDQAKQLKYGYLKDVKIGDKVFNINGELVEVLEIHDQPKPLRVYEITLSDKRTVKCSGDHIWSVLKRGTNKAKDRLIQKTVDEMRTMPLIKNNAKGHGEYRWKIPKAQSIKTFPTMELPVPPYVLGILLGDGYLASASNMTFVSSGDLQIIEELERELDYVYSVDKCRPNDDQDYAWVFHIRDKEHFTGKTLTEQLAALDLRHTTMGKFIPDIYKFSSEQQRRALLQGLMDSDGSSNNGRYSFTTINKRLRDDVLWLMRSLGYICSYSIDYRPDKYHNSDGRCWNISLQTNDENVFRLFRKKQDSQEYKPQQTKVAVLPFHSDPIIFDSQSPRFKLPPYLYGMLCVKSQSKAIRLRCSSEYVVKNVIDVLPENVRLVPVGTSKDGSAYSLQNTIPHRKNIIHEMLIELGEDERSPKRNGLNKLYLRADVKDRLELLQGIMDARGTWTSMGFPAFVPQNNQMREDFIDLLDNLGYKWFIPNAKTSNYMIAIETQDLNIFKDKSKQEIMSNWLMITGRADGRSQMERDYQYVSIVDIKETDDYEDMRCLYVDDPAHMFLVEDFIPTHNTTISVMLATQLNWYFNPELMQHLTTSYTARILLLSLNEFDDIPTHGIGYDEYLSDENDNDGKNIVELIRRIDETNGEPTWDDISYCFVATKANRVFYLPSLTQREAISGNIVVSAQDYKKVIDVCSKFFSFIVMDSPDLFYHEKADIMNFAFSVSDIICFVIEADTHSTTHLYHFFDGLRGDTNKFPLDANKCICVVNKYVSNGNVYMPIPPIGQLQFEKIAKSMSKYFARFVAIPFTQPRAMGNILDGTDPKVKYAAAELADDVLELIDYNDEVAEKKKQQRKRRG